MKKGCLMRKGWLTTGLINEEGVANGGGLINGIWAGKRDGCHDNNEVRLVSSELMLSFPLPSRFPENA